MKKLILIACFLAAACIVVAVPALLPVGRSASPVLASAGNGGSGGGSSPGAPVEGSDERSSGADGDVPAAAETDATERPAEEGPHPGRLAFVADRCDLCHTVYTAGIGQPPEETEGDDESESMDLSDVGSSRGADWLMSYLRKEAEIDGAKHYRAFKGTEEEEAELVDWLVTLGAPADSAAASESLADSAAAGESPAAGTAAGGTAEETGSAAE